MYRKSVGLIPRKPEHERQVKLFRGNNSMAQHRQSVTVYPTLDTIEKNRGTD